MELNWLQSLILGLVSGLTDILPMSAQAHQTILFNFFGSTGEVPVTRLVIHSAVLLTTLGFLRGRLGQVRRQLRLVRMPRRRRNRPVDMAALMDARIVRTALVPILALLVLYGITRRWNSLPILAAGSLLNALVLYLPGLFPTADKDSRLVTPMESLFMGLGTGAAVLPGISSVGTSYSLGVLHGMDRKYMVHLSLFMHLIFTAGMMFYDILDIITQGSVAADVWAILSWVLAGLSAAFGTTLGLRGLERAAHKNGLTSFSFYSFGMALLAFILYLMV